MLVVCHQVKKANRCVSVRFFLSHVPGSIKSDRYIADGYWRGPIWPPVTLIIIDGLWRSGQQETARTITRAFCELVAKNGPCENYDACSRAGLRDTAYTWSSSIFFILVNKYLRR